MKVVIQVISGKYPQVDTCIVEDTAEALRSMHYFWYGEYTFRKIGTVMNYNSIDKITYHMPTEWIPGNNPIPEAFNTKKFYELLKENLTI